MSPGAGGRDRDGWSGGAGAFARQVLVKLEAFIDVAIELNASVAEQDEHGEGARACAPIPVDGRSRCT
jgi:hypothetical protein